MTAPTPADLSALTVRELLGLDAAIITELARRNLVSTRDKPIGGISERIVHRARGGTLEPNSTKSHDVTTPTGSRIQVKAMGERAAGNGAKFSPFRSFDFDTAIFLVFNGPTFNLVIAREVASAEVASLGRYSQHTNGRQPTLSQVSKAGEDVLAEMTLAYGALDVVIDAGSSRQ